jgi:hypothetical protein
MNEFFWSGNQILRQPAGCYWRFEYCLVFSMVTELFWSGNWIFEATCEPSLKTWE